MVDIYVVCVYILYIYIYQLYIYTYYSIVYKPTFTLLGAPPNVFLLKLGMGSGIRFSRFGSPGGGLNVVNSKIKPEKIIVKFMNYVR